MRYAPLLWLACVPVLPFAARAQTGGVTFTDAAHFAVHLGQDAGTAESVWVQMPLSGRALVFRSAEPLPRSLKTLSLLVRAVERVGSQVVSYHVVCDTHDIAPDEQIAISQDWQPVVFSVPDGLPEESWRLEVESEGKVRIQLLLPADPDIPWSAEQALRQMIARCTASGNLSDLRAAWRALGVVTPDSRDVATGLRQTAELSATAGDTKGAVDAYLDALDANGRQVADARSPDLGYGANRAALDFSAQAQSRLLQIARAASGEAAALAYRAAASHYPLRPDGKEAALACAREEVRLGNVQEAVAWLAMLFDAGGDHDAVATPVRLAENQRHLDAISKPTDAALLRDGMALLLECTGAKTGDTLPATAIDDMVTAWQAGEAAGISGDAPTCAEHFTEVASNAEGTDIALCARVALSQWLRYLGYFVEAERALPPASSSTAAALEQWRSFQQGRLRMSQGSYADAQAAFERAAAGPGALVCAYASLYTGECLEFQGAWDRAGEGYSRLSQACSIPEVRMKAAAWLRRLQGIGAECRPAFGQSAFYWGEDRQTRGGWDAYGHELFIVCGRMAPADLMGGAAAPVAYNVTTSDPNRHYWWWNWHSVAPHPSVLREPLPFDATASNWDDGGEKYGLGRGPDLLVELPIPDGLHRLSLYVVNDFNYYEPNREYTMYLLDGDANVLAGCAVRDFEGGVYHHFALLGPRTVTVRLCRNLSMNTLLQGVFIDRLDTGPDLAPQADCYGPLSDLIEGASAADLTDAVGLCDGRVRGDAVASLLGNPPGSLAEAWRSWRLLNAYGAGCAYEREHIDRIKSAVASAVGEDALTGFWSGTADAQLAAGRRAGAILFTRFAVEAGSDISLPTERRLDVLCDALARMQTKCDYYIGTPGGPATPPHVGPVDDEHSRELAEECVTVARAGLPQDAAHAFLAGLARECLQHGAPSLARYFYESAGVDDLSHSDTYGYSRCCTDPQVWAQMLQRVLPSAGTEGLPHESCLRLSLIDAYAETGAYADAETQVELLEQLGPEHESAKANGIYNLATHMMVRGNKDGAATWYRLLLDRYPHTPFAQLAQKQLDGGLRLPWEGKTR